MKVLLVTGFACPAERWRSLLEFLPNLEILSFRDQLENAENPRDLRSLGQYVAQRIQDLHPDLIIAHDFGVPTSVIGLLKYKKKERAYLPKIILFNSALRGISLLRVTHPFKAQYLSWESIENLIQENSGEVDGGLKSFFPQIRSIYRQVILSNVLEKFKMLSASKVRSELSLGSRVLLVKSDNDPFFPKDIVEKMAKDIRGTETLTVNYGHFPYSIEKELIIPKIEQWLKNSSKTGISDRA